MQTQARPAKESQSAFKPDPGEFPHIQACSIKGGCREGGQKGSFMHPGSPSLKTGQLRKEEDTDRQKEEDMIRLLKITP